MAALKLTAHVCLVLLFEMFFCLFGLLWGFLFVWVSFWVFCLLRACQSVTLLGIKLLLDTDAHTNVQGFKGAGGADARLSALPSHEGLPI